MKARVEREAFANATRSAARQLPAKPNQPVYATLRLQAADGRLVVTGYDGAVCATRASLEAEILADGSTLVPGALLAQIACALTGEYVELTLEDAGLALASAGGAYLVATCDEHDYPRLPAVRAVSGVVAADLLTRAVRHVVPAADIEGEAGPAFAGVRIQASGRRLVFTATDRYRIAQQEIEWAPADPGIEIAAVVPVLQLKEAVRAIGERGDVEVSLPASGRHAALSGNGTSITLRTIAERYPPVDAVLEAAATSVAACLEAEATELLACARRVRLAAADNSPLRLRADVETLTLSAVDGVTSRGRERMDAQLEGPDEIELGMKANYLCDALMPLRGGTARISASLAHKPFVIEGDQAEGYRCLVMPQRDLRASA